MIIDASALLPAYFPDEDQLPSQRLLRDYVLGELDLAAPTLLVYEIANAVMQAIRRGRIREEQGMEALDTFEGLGIPLFPVTWQGMAAFARRFDRSAYDASYLALASERGEPFITGDRRMYNAVKEDLDWVIWIGDFFED
jgi:predicted nucleic acid-binding protein